MHDKTNTPAALDDALLQDNTRPGFAEPWQAELFAMTHALSQRGVFTWPQWAAASRACGQVWSLSLGASLQEPLNRSP